MPSHKSLFLMSLLSLTVTACQSTPATQTPTPSVSASPSTQPSPGASASPDGVTPTPGTTPVPTTPTPTPTPQPGAGSEGTVTLPNGSRLIVSLDNRFLSAVGQTSQLRTSLVDAAGQPLPMTGVTLNFVSSRPQDISVSATGLITALKENGFSQITANVVGTSLSTTLQVSVASGEGGGGGGGGGGGSATPQPSASPTEDVDVDLGFEGLGLGEFQINTQTLGTQNDAVTAMSADGSFVVAWAGEGVGDSDGVFAQRFNSDGVPAGAEFRVNSEVVNYQGDPAIAINDSGDFVVVWESAGQEGDAIFNANVYGQRYNSLGVAQGSEFRVNTSTTDTQHRAAVALDNNGEFVVTWTSFQDFVSLADIYAQRFDSMGLAEGTEFRVNTATSGSQNSSSVALDDDGDFVVTWASARDDGSSIQARRYLSSDDFTNPQNAEFQIATTGTTNELRSPQIALDGEGDFVVAWNSYGYNNPDFDGEVFARRYNAGGTDQGNAFQVNTYTSGYQSNVEIAMDTSGDFVISWQSVPEDGSTNGVYARRYNAAATAQGTPFRVNTMTSGSQSAPDVAMDDDGNFVIIWSTEGQDGNGSGVYAKRYAANGRVR
ncbi:MAG: hypothetical protein ACO1RX_19815 [Candidatus Sericytochromatia bacterium]